MIEEIENNEKRITTIINRDPDEKILVSYFDKAVSELDSFSKCLEKDKKVKRKRNKKN